MHIRVQTWKEINKKKLAKFFQETRQQEDLLSDSTTMETYLNYFEWAAARSDSVPIVAYSNNHIIGWLGFFSFVPKICTIGRWHPVVTPGPQREKIARELLKSAVSHAREQGFERFEAELTQITPKTESHAQEYQGWFKNLGLSLATEEARLEHELSKESLPPVDIPPGFELVPLSEYTNEELQDPFFDMFDNSIDRFWLSQTVKQRVDQYKTWFNPERAFIDQATSILVKDKEIVGVTVVVQVQEAGMLGPIGVVPRFRRQGLGRGLLAFSMRGTLASGLSKVQLEFDITNKPAMALYEAMGFQHVHGLRIFAMAL